MESGTFPNIFYGTHARDLSDVAAKYPHRFIGLPQGDQIRIDGRHSYRYVREGDPMWTALHKGMMTTGRLNAALGLYEPHAAKVLGLSKGWVSHSRIVSAYEHLLDAGLAGLSQSAGQVGEDLRVMHEQVHAKAEYADNGAFNRNDEFECIKRRKSRYLQSRGDMNAVRMSWGSAQEPSAVGMLCESFEKGAYIMEAGLMALDDDDIINLGFDPAELPPMGSTPDSMCVDCVSKEEAVRAYAALGAKQRGGFGRVIEVKNVCPFSISRNHGGKKSSKFVVRDRGPANRVLGVHVPQLQFHMLCSGTESAFLVSRSATKGTRIFEMKRDDDYIHLLLQILREFYTAYVLKKKIPARNTFANLRVHRQMLLKTRELAYQCPLYCEIDRHKSILHGSDERFFIDD